MPLGVLRWGVARESNGTGRFLPLVVLLSGVTALAACTGLSWFGVRLDPEVYYIDRLPVNVDAKDYAFVALRQPACPSSLPLP